MTQPASTNVFLITIEPAGRRINLAPGQSLLDAARLAGIEINAVCGGGGTCADCKVNIITGQVSPPSPQETRLLTKVELRSGVRLACQTIAQSDAVIHFPPESLGSLQRLQLEGIAFSGAINPAVRRLEIDLAPSVLNAKLPAGERLREALLVHGYPQVFLSKLNLKILDDLFEQNTAKVSVALRDQNLVTCLPPAKSLLGLAVDLGTTKLAAFLVNLESGKVLASGGALNPQIACGEDVINRIRFVAEHPQGGVELQRMVVNTIQGLAQDLSTQAGTSINEIVDCVVVGNTVMHHLFAGLPVESLGESPYMPVVIAPLTLPGREVGLHMAANASIYLPPNIAGFVGGDHTATLLSTEIRHSMKTTLALDIGTNTEISLVHKGRHLCCSCASGPAFEGAHIQHGLRAVPGAIEHVAIDNQGVHVQTINGNPAIGICGSGMVDAVSAMRENEMIDARGAFNRKDVRLATRDGSPALVLVNAANSGSDQEIRICRKDVQEIQLAKAAIRSGIEVLLREASISAEEIEQFFLAGAFGTYLNPVSCIKIGMFPSLPLERFSQVGNAAGSGAIQLLLSLDKRSEVSTYPDQIEYIELTMINDYMDLFSTAIGL